MPVSHPFALSTEGNPPSAEVVEAFEGSGLSFPLSGCDVQVSRLGNLGEVGKLMQSIIS